MPTLINDWDSTKRQVVVRYATKCTRCGQAKVTDTPELAEGWEEDTSPNADGRTPAQCPDCGRE